MSTARSEDERPPDDIDLVDLVDLVARAKSGSDQAWTALFERFLPVVRAVARSYRLTDIDIDDVGQAVWLLLLENVDRIREPRALPAWLITTTRRESLRLIRQRRRTVLVDPLTSVSDDESGTDTAVDADLLRLEAAQVLLRSLAELPPLQRDLLRLFSDEPTMSYREISAVLTMPVGSIGPTRARGLARLRATPAMRNYLFPTWSEDRPA
jgi:RNA polymerase sigma factor (sigma-70 family)